MKKSMKAGILFLVLGVPVLIYFLLKSSDMTKAAPDLPYLFSEGFSQELEDSLYARIPTGDVPFQQNTVNVVQLKVSGAELTKEELQLAKVIESYEGREKSVQVFSLVSDVTFQAKKKNPLISWELLEVSKTSPSVELFSQWKLAASAQEVKYPVWLIDQEGYCRGQYDLADKKEVQRLVLETNVLLTNKEYGSK